MATTIPNGHPLHMTSKLELTANKLMLNVWRNRNGIIRYELLQPGKTVKFELYCHELNSLEEVLLKKRTELINRKAFVLHHDKARPHSSLEARQKQKKSLKRSFEAPTI